MISVTDGADGRASKLQYIKDRALLIADENKKGPHFAGSGRLSSAIQSPLKTALL